MAATFHQLHAVKTPGPEAVGHAAPVTCNIVRMADQETPPTTRQRVADHRARLRRQGLRPVQIWVPDVRAPGFAAEAHRQSALAAASAAAADDQAFVDAISWFGDEGNDRE